MAKGPNAALTAFVLGLALMGAAPAMAQSEDLAPVEITEPAVANMADWAVRSGDNQGLPFAIVDKASARAFVFDGGGSLLGSTAVLIGVTPGDDSVPGIGDRELSNIPPEDRTTPAGRFVGGYGPSATKGEVLWVDYETALSMHPVVTTNPAEKRLKRLKSETVADNRITFGCINVPTEFYAEVVEPTFLGTQGVFYILPETRSLAEVFPQFGAVMQASIDGDSASF